MLSVMVTLALVMRCGVVGATLDYEPAFDSLDFARHAASIAEGNGFPETLLAAEGGPTAFRPPAYPFLLGGVFVVSGDSVTAARLAGALLGTIVVLLVYLIAARLWGRRTGWIAGMVAALFPPLAFWNAALLSEPLFLAVELAAVLSVLLLRESDKAVRWSLLAGILCGIAALTRSNGALLVVPIALGVWGMKPRGAPRSFAYPALVIVGAILVIAPWSVRNTLAFDAFLPTTTQSGYGLAGTYNETARTDGALRGTFLPPQYRGPYQPLFRREDLDEVELDHTLRERAVDYAWSHPSYVIEASFLNLLRMAGLGESRTEASLTTGGSTIGPTAAKVGEMGTYALIAAAIVGAVILTRRGHPRWGPLFVWLIPLFMVIPGIPIAGGPRYRAPADPFLILLAAVALGAAWAAAQRRIDRDAHKPSATAGT